jgi:hypothetical protein
MEKYHLYVIVAFMLGVCIKLYDDYTDFENLKIPRLHIDIFRMMIFILNTILTLGDYRFSFVPILAVIGSYIADSMKTQSFVKYMNHFIKYTIETFKNSSIWNKLSNLFKQIINEKYKIDVTEKFTNAINDNHWIVYMISSIICIIFSFLFNPKQLELRLITQINIISLLACILFNLFEPYLFPEECSDAKILSRIYGSCIIFLVIIYGNNFVDYEPINYIISYSVLGYISMSSITMSIYKYLENKKNNDELKNVS